MKYDQPSEEAIQQIKDLFSVSPIEWWTEDPENWGGTRDGTLFRIECQEDGYHITITQMYDYIEFKDDISSLQAMLKIAEILGCKDGTEKNRYGYSGCETCDFGSQYTLEFHFW